MQATILMICIIRHSSTRTNWPNLNVTIHEHAAEGQGERRIVFGRKDPLDAIPIVIGYLEKRHGFTTVGARVYVRLLTRYLSAPCASMNSSIKVGAQPSKPDQQTVKLVRNEHGIMTTLNIAFAIKKWGQFWLWLQT
jgi:hypothetical protein